MKRIISICVPCYNEQENVNLIYVAITEEMKKLPQYDYEIVFRDNASTDDTYKELKMIASKDHRVKVIENMVNYGPGMRGSTYGNYLSGDIVLGIAADLQEPVELISDFVYYYEQGYDIVVGQKTSSDEGRIKYLLRSIFYRIIDWFSEKKQYSHVSGMFLCSREIYTLATEFCWQMPFRYFIAELGHPIKIVQYRQKEREHGKSHMKIGYLLDFAIKALTITSTKPIRIMTIVGLICSLVCLIISIIYLLMKLIYWNTFQMGIAPLIIGVFLIGSIQFFAIGLIGEYLAMVIDRVSKRFPSFVKETINCEKVQGEDAGDRING